MEPVDVGIAALMIGGGILFASLPMLAIHEMDLSSECRLKGIEAHYDSAQIAQICQ